MARLALSLLGQLNFKLNGTLIGKFEYDKVRALLIYLAVEAKRPHRREALTALLWPDQPDSSARVNLRQALSTLRKALGDDQAEQPFLLVTRESVQLNPAADCWLDFTAIESLLEASDKHQHRHDHNCRACARRLAEAADLYGGPFLGEFYLPDSAPFEEWALLKREWLHRRFGQALAWLVTYHERRGDYRQALTWARQLLELDPWREEAHRQVMRLLALAGERSAALAQYERCRAVLQEELGVEPEPETTGLYERIREAVNEGETLGLALPAERPHALPLQITPFIGRERELDEIGKLLDHADVRLLSLVGPGGSGKTRLALQAGIDQLESFQEGVYFVPLAALDSAALLASTIAERVGCELSGGQGAEQQLLDFLRDREVLLILDNIEHLLDGTALLEQILHHAPAATLLVTSRERLNLPGEWVFWVTGLSLPNLPEYGEPDLELVESNEAVRLFLQSARRSHHSFQLTSENWQSVVQICQLVGGLPLAIELAASWVRVLSCEEIAAEIENKLLFLSSSPRGADERQRSLTAVFEHSWRLLSDEEKAILQRLSVFYNGFNRQAGEQVAGAVLPLLAGLVDKSLLQYSPAGRYEMHELLRQYAWEKLDKAGELEGTRDKHLNYFLRLAMEAARCNAQTYQKVWLQRLEAEHDNLRTALSWSLLERTSEEGVRLAVSLYRFWYWHSHFNEGSSWLKTALEKDERLPADLVAEAAYAAGVLFSEQDDYELAKVYLEKSLHLRRALGEQLGTAHALNSLGLIAWSQQEYARAFELLEESLAVRRAIGERSSLAKPLNSLGLVALAMGDSLKAMAYFEESLALSQEDNDEMGIAATLSNLAAAFSDAGQPAEALARFQESLQIFERIGDHEGIAWCLEGIGAVLIGDREADTGARLCGTAEALRKRIRAPLTLPERARYQSVLEKARAKLGSSALRAALDEGGELPEKQAIAQALETNLSGSSE